MLSNVYSIVKGADKIVRELDASAKGWLDKEEDGDRENWLASLPFTFACVEKWTEWEQSRKHCATLRIILAMANFHRVFTPEIVARNILEAG